MKHVFRIAGVAVRELLYERLFYVLLAFAVGSFVASGLLGQVTFAEQGRLTLDFLLAGQQLALALVAVFVSISLFQRELVSGSVAMVLSKPVSRTAFLLGKFLGQLCVQTGLALLLGLFSWVYCQWLGFAPGIAILQSTLLASCEAAVLAAAAYFFAVNAGAVAAAIGSIGFFLVGHLRLSGASAKTSLSDTLFRQLVRGVFPDLEIFNVRLLASYGQTLPWSDFAWAATYGALSVTAFLVAACLCFSRRDILA